MIKRVLLISAMLPGIACAAQQNLNYTTTTNWKTEGPKAQNNFTELYTALGTKEAKAVVQASAPADTSVDWYDTDQESGVLILKRHNGTTWLRASSHGVQYASNCAGITAGMCVDTDDGKLYYHNNTEVVEVGTGTGGTGDIEGVTASTGLTGGGTTGTVTVAVDPTYVQRRVSSTCSAGTSIRAIAEDGTVTCETDDTGSGSVPSGTVDGQVLLWATDQWAASTAPWVTTSSLGTDVAAALAAPVDGTGGLASKASLDALPNIVFGTGLTVSEDTPSAGTDTVSITANTYQAYDANMIAWPSTISATEVGYLDGLTEALSTSLSGKQATLVSGTNIKTVNNTSLLGSGNIDIAGSGSFAFDTFPEYEDSAHSSGIAVNGTTLAIYSSTAGKWLTVGLTDTLDATPVDTTPDAFSFADVTNAALSTEYTALAQINGIAAGITCSGSGGTVAACTGSTEGTCGTFGATSGSITNGQYVGAKVNSSGTASTPVNNIVTCGGVSDTFTTTTTASGPVVLAQNTVNNYTISLVPLTSPSYIAVQSFQVTQSGNADSIALWIANTGTSANLVVRIGTTNDMSTTYLASGSKNLTSWVEGEQIVSLDSSVTLTEGTTYYVAVYASTGNDVILKGSSTSAYSYNFYYTTTGWPAASSRSDIDMYFQIGTNL